MLRAAVQLGDVSSAVRRRHHPAALRTRLRVVAIADLLTTVRINSGSANSYIDWRSDYAALTYELIEPPHSVACGIRRLVRSFDLVYAALDFIVAPDGEWVFLEINAGGQYGWL